MDIRSYDLSIKIDTKIDTSEKKSTQAKKIDPSMRPIDKGCSRVLCRNVDF